MKKILMYLGILLSFMGIGFLISQIQTMRADLVFQANGLTATTKELTPNSTKSIRTFLRHVTKVEQGNDHSQIQFINNAEPDQILVWADYDLASLPIHSGRYFVKNDFIGQISFGIISPKSLANVTTTQGNQYVVLGDSYVSVIGTLKDATAKTVFFISTGIHQQNSRDQVANYTVLIDNPNYNKIKKFAKYIDAKIKTPNFVKKTQEKHLDRPYLQYLGLGLMMFVSLLLSIGIAILNREITMPRQLKGRFLQMLQKNELMRFLVVQTLFFLLVMTVLNFTLNFTNFEVFFFYGLGSLMINMLGYTIILVRRKRGTME